jgi:formylglycine-generating enzyme required for sulfatase activity
MSRQSARNLWGMISAVVSATVLATVLANATLFSSAYASEPTTAQPEDETPPPAAVYLPLIMEPYSTFLPIIHVRPSIDTPYPVNNGVRQSLNSYLTWEAVDAKLQGATYTVYFERDDATPDETIATGLTATAYDLLILEEDTRYYWQIVAVNSSGEEIAGPVWTFTTDYFSDVPDMDAMVYVPGGTFLMGCDGSNPYENVCTYGESHQDEPVHTVNVDALYIDKYEVTNGEYQHCVNDGRCALPRVQYEYNKPEYALHPVTHVSWWDAQTYCAWEGKRLPTEAEWEKAARGSLDTRKWPWGNEPADCTRLNSNFYRDGENCELLEQGTTPVNKYPRGASPFGALDMSGNVFEWVSDKYDVFYYNYSPADNPQGPPTSRVTTWFQNRYQAPSEDQLGYPVFTIRGGSWRDSRLYLRVSHRHWGHHGDIPYGDPPYFRSDRLGFRCAQSVVSE